MLVGNTAFNKPKPESSKRTSTRKHEGVRSPSARNAIVRDRNTGAYTASVDATQVDTLAGISLRLNAIELTLSRFVHGEAVDRSYAAPATVREAVQAANLPANVVPMDVARKAKEQSKAEPASHPLPVSGNEVLALPAPEPVVIDVKPEPPLKVADTVPTHIGKDTLTSSETVAANDEVLVPDEAIEILKQITNEKPEVMEQLADAYGMDIVECSHILYKEYSKREKQCYKDHGLPRDDVRAERAGRQRGLVECNGNLNRVCPVFIQAENSKFSDWFNETESRMKHLRSQAEARRVSEVRTTPAPLVKGEAAYRKKSLTRRLASERRADPAAFAKIQRVSAKFPEGGKVTTASQWAAITTAAWSGYQKARKLLGMQPTVRGTRRRLKYEVEDALCNPATGNGDRKMEQGDLFAAVDLSTPTVELVRRYQRAGIGY